MGSNAFSDHFEGRYRISEFSHVNLVFIYTLTAFVSYSFVRFLPHLLMVKYDVFSIKYFVDVTLFIPK